MRFAIRLTTGILLRWNGWLTRRFYMQIVETQAKYRLLDTRPRVLAKFFQASRDKWKRKCQQAHAENKKLRDQARDVRESRQHWREQAEQAQCEKQRLAADVQLLKEQLAVAEKKVSAVR
jgi:predicted  nucleic acid-binding Zn-ribbon protein